MQLLDRVRGAWSRQSPGIGKEWLYGLSVFAFFAAFFLSVYLPLEGIFSLDDHLFHIRFASTLLENGLSAFTEFSSLPFTQAVAEHEHLIYYNFLFYFVLLPFSFFSPLALGIKLYGVFALTLSLSVVYLFLRRIAVPQAFLWTLLLLVVLSESGLLYRFLSARPFTLAPVFLIALLYCFYRKWHGVSLMIAFAYFYWHTATFFLPLGMAAVYFLFDQYSASKGAKPDWRLFSMPLAGTVVAAVLSYLIFPGALSYLVGITLPVLTDAAFSGGVGIAEGSEVYGPGFFAVFLGLFPLIALFLLFGMAELFRMIGHGASTTEHATKPDTALQPLRATLFMGTLVLLVLSSFSLRFVDYFVYFCVLSVALSATDFSRSIVIRDARLATSFRIGGALVILLLLIAVRLDFSSRPVDVQSYHLQSPIVAQAPAQWLEAHVPAGQVLFNLDWDAFPAFYYFTGDRFRYATGLEPRFLYEYDARRYWLWKHIGDDGLYCEASHCPDRLSAQTVAVGSDAERGAWFEAEGARIATVIREDFETDIVITRTDRVELIQVMDRSSHFEPVFVADDSPYAIYRIVGY